CEYTCVSEAESPVALLWALHPQFTMMEGSRLVVQGERSTLLDTSRPGEPHNIVWPGDIMVERDVVAGEHRMFYLHPDDVVGQAMIIDPSGSTLSVSWDRSFAPYLGIWADN